MRTLLARTAFLFGVAFAAAAQAQPTVTTPAMVCQWCDVYITWSGLASPSTSDILKLTTPSSTNALNWRFTSGAASGTLPLNVHSGVPFGIYVVRIERASVILATSAPFEVAPFVAGTVTSGGSPLAGVSVAGTNGAQCNGITDASGYWHCTVPYNWSGTVTVSKPGNLFSPASRSYTNLTAIINNHSFATVPAHAVSGTITFDGGPLSGAATAGSNGAICTSTNASGEYTCTVAQGWSGTVTPSMADRVFTPASRSYTNVTAAQPAQDYIAQATFYQVSGSVTLNGLALPNVALAATGGPTCSSTNSSGQYSCTVPLNWSGSLTPSASGYSFGPASRSYTSVSSHQTAQTFTATLDTAAAPLYFVHVDHLNTPRLVANQSGQAVWRWDQEEPFGNNVPDENPSGLGVFEQPLRFPGQYADKETNLYYNYFREYDPNAGRYSQSDPIGLKGGLNSYLYVAGNSLSLTDRKGLAFVCNPRTATCVFVPDPVPQAVPPSMGGALPPGTEGRDRPSERPGRPESRADRPEMKLEPPATDNPINFPDDVPLFLPEDCPPDCRERQRELLWLRSNIIYDGTPYFSVQMFNEAARKHNLRCGLFFYVMYIELVQ